MKMFKKYGNDISYRDILQVDGADATWHVLYCKSPIFNGISAKNIEDELKKDKILSDKVYEQAIGFLRIPEGSNLLDATSIHPES